MVYQTSEELISNLKILFGRIQAGDGTATKAVSDAHLIIRICTHDPRAEITINGRKSPVSVSYQKARLRPDLDIDLSADVLHAILMGERSLKLAFTRGEMKVKGPIWKAFSLDAIFKFGQTLYPQVYASSLTK
jgi:hypothetical protein